MKPIPIFHIKSNRKIIKSADVDTSLLQYSGNGILISNDGLLATLNHVLQSDKNTNNFAFIENFFYKINMLPLKPTTRGCSLNDAALCNITINSSQFFDPINFVDIRNNSVLNILGYSRMLIADNKNIQSVSDSIGGLKLFEIKAMCLSTTYKSLLDSFTISFTTLNRDPHGLSGSTIINEDDKVVGLFKGGPEIIGLNNSYYLLGQAIHIELYKEMYVNYNNKA